ncbi:hypothetical protein RB598_004563 [Gaeumannomyces tritici]
MDQADIPALLSRLASDEDAARKMAVFKLQSSINDPAFADVFISSGGLVILRRLIMTAGGNTLAYSLQSLTRLLEVDMGWDIFEGPSAGDLVERVVELIVHNPLVNILRGAMSILVALVSHSQSTPRGAAPRTPGTFGFRALKPAVAVYPQFFELVIQQLQSADHALCANALMLINALIRDAVSSETRPTSGTVKSPASSTIGASTSGGEEWSKFIKRLQDLGLIKAVYNLMQSSALQDLAHPLIEFQSLTKALLRRWKEVRVDLERPEHRRALKGLHLASAPDRQHLSGDSAATAATTAASDTAPATTPASAALAKKASRRHNPEKWRRLGFETESPTVDFEVPGFLGMMDLTDYVRKHEDGFQKLLLEQSSRPLAERCPVARASFAVTMVLYEHFEVEKSDLEDPRTYQALEAAGTKGSGGGAAGSGYDKVFRPLLLQWSRLHTAGLHAFFRLWKVTRAERDDFDKVAELVRILIEQVVGQAIRTKDVGEVEEELQEYDCARLRDVQMGLLELSFEDQWGQHMYQAREELKHEALQFVKEQRIRCLLQGSWFSRPVPKRDQHQRQDSVGAVGLAKKRLYEAKAWRFAKLSHNRRFLHYADFASQTAQDPGLEDLTDKVDLGTISSVVSNVSAPSGDDRSASSMSTLQNSGGGGGGKANGTSGGLAGSAPPPKSTTKITVYSYVDAEEAARGGEARGGETREQAILTLYPLNHSLASEWLDGLLMLLNQQPITSDTNKLVALVSDYGLKIRLLNVRVEAVYQGPPPGAGVVPSREGLDDDYYYEL